MEGNLPETPPPAARRRREPARGNPVVRALGWAIGIAVVLGTTLLVIVAVTQPEPTLVAEAAKPVRKCPPDVSVPARPIGFPVDDVMGVRPGMSAHDIEEIVKCVSEDYEIETRALTSGVVGTGRPSRPLVTAKRGDDTVSVAMFGGAGQEQAVAVWREAFFDVGKGPAPAVVEGMFVAQYGAPHEARTTPEGARLLTWTYAPDGRPLRKRPADGDVLGMASYMAQGWTVAACVQNIRTDPDAALAADERCGLTVRAEIDPGLSDGAHVSRWRVVLIDQPTLMRQSRPVRATPG